MELRHRGRERHRQDHERLAAATFPTKVSVATPPVKTRIGPIYVDAEVAAYLDQLWRAQVDDANRRQQRIPKFGEFVAEILKDWVQQQKAKHHTIR